MIVFNRRWDEIKEEDWPPAGEYFTCIDPQEWLGTQTWIVSKMGDGTAQNDTKHYGVFWEKEMAVKFLETLEAEEEAQKSETVDAPEEQEEPEEEGK